MNIEDIFSNDKQKNILINYVKDLVSYDYQTKEEYNLEYGTDAIEIHSDAINNGDKVLILDDLLATGGTAKATCNIVKRLGGEILCIAFLIRLKGLKGKENLNSLPIYAILEY